MYYGWDECTISPFKALQTCPLPTLMFVHAHKYNLNVWLILLGVLECCPFFVSLLSLMMLNHSNNNMNNSRPVLVAFYD